MASVGWLHLTDLHFGLSGQKWLWPTVREQFFRDLERLHARSGPWDLVLFTGDLTQRGTKEEFDRLTETLGKLWDHLAKLGSKPALVTVPGNHDLQRPKLGPAVRALRNWNDDPTLREEFWAGADNEYRAAVSDAFTAYEGFVSAHSLPADFKVGHGVLSGDRSISLERDGLKLALVGLNTAFLQLEGGNYQGKLDVDVRQLHGVCGDDPPEWLGAHHVALLLTHHPTTWLHPRTLAGFKADIAPPGRFLAHLFGHMHEGSTTSLAVSGSSPQRAVQGPSLFGLETWGDGAEQRIHGYMAGRITLKDMQGTFALWPRELRKNRAGAWQMTPDGSFDLHEEAAVEELKPRKAALSVAGGLLTPTPISSLRGAATSANTSPVVASSITSGPLRSPFEVAAEMMYWLPQRVPWPATMSGELGFARPAGPAGYGYLEVIALPVTNLVDSSLDHIRLREAVSAARLDERYFWWQGTRDTFGNRASGTHDYIEITSSIGALVQNFAICQFHATGTLLRTKVLWDDIDPNQNPGRVLRREVAVDEVAATLFFLSRLFREMSTPLQIQVVFHNLVHRTLSWEGIRAPVMNFSCVEQMFSLGVHANANRLGSAQVRDHIAMQLRRLFSLFNCNVPVEIIRARLGRCFPES